MEPLIEIMNELLTLFMFAYTKTKSISLPQIVVVGDQSSGKSSVLESLVGESFLPRGTGIVTRCPTILRLVQVHRKGSINGLEMQGQYSKKLKKGTFQHFSLRTYVDLFSGPNTSDESNNNQETWCEFEHMKGEKFTNFNLVREEIEKETNLLAGSNKDVVDAPIILTVYSPKVVTLTVVDLPGIARNPVGDQPKDIERRILALIYKYIKEENSIILAVHAACTDIASCSGFQVANGVDPKLDRTLLVVTKLDMMCPGTDATKLLTGGDIPVKLGIVGVVNRSQKDIGDNKTVEEALASEAQFLQKTYPTLASSNGTKFLANKLNTILKSHISKCLPKLESEINVQLVEHKAKLKKLVGSEFGSQSKQSILLRLIEKYCDSYKEPINGSSDISEANYLPVGARIRLMWNTVLNEKLHWVDKLNRISNEEIMMKILAVNGLEGNMGPQDAFQCFVKKLIKLMKEPLLECADLILNELKIVTSNCVTEEIAHYSRLKHEMVKILNNLWNTRCEIWKAHLEEHIDIEASHIDTDHEDFLEGLEKMKCDEKNGLVYQLEEKNNFNFNIPALPAAELCKLSVHCKEVKKLICLYFGIFLKTLKHHFRESLVKEVIRYAMDQLNMELMMNLYTPQNPHKIDELMQEAEDVAEAKQNAEIMIKSLQKAKEIIENTRSNI